jgi:predicted signal transduction protein with EAL and GGDEF domain
MADRLRGRLRAEDLVARQGGDEFLVLLSDLGGDAEERALAVGATLVDALRAPVELPGLEFEISCSVGVSIFPRDAADAESLLAHADSAMYQAKGAGRGQVRAFDGRRHADPERLSMSRRLRRALADDELVLHWQPIVSLRTGLLKGAEALVRWQDPQRGLVPAGSFVADVEAAGLLDTLDEWVARALTAQRRAWRAAGLDPHVGFNLGPRSLTPARVGRILDCLGRGELPLDRVTIEISESEALQTDGLVGAAVQGLAEAGLTLALDDFGVAYSSLSRLRDVPAEWIKVDRSFLKGVPEDPAATAIFDAILHLLSALDTRTIVEGVETPDQVRHLLERGCDAAQGFHLGPPMPAAEIEPLLRASPDSSRAAGAAAVVPVAP